LNEVLQAKLEPIRTRREDYAKNMDYVQDMLKQGSEKAEKLAAQTLDEVKEAMGINYY
ncbi:tryptophan--tRNA ligase, partial [Klebsiella oxytoca]